MSLSTPAILDELDLALIALLRENGRMPYQAIAEVVGVSAPTVRARVDRLIADGVIRITAVVQPEAIGFPVLAALFIETEVTKAKAVAESLATMEEVAFVSIAAGDPDIYASIRVRSNHMLAEFMTEKLAKVPGIRKTRLLLLLKVLKQAARWDVPRQIDEDPAYVVLDGEEPPTPLPGRGSDNVGVRRINSMRNRVP